MSEHGHTDANIPIHGNYHGYYSKRPNLPDPRLSLLSSSIFLNATVLDIGCNEGRVTCEIAQLWNAKKVVGVDIDDALITTAWRRRRAVWSLQGPTSAAPKASDENSDQDRVLERVGREKCSGEAKEERPQKKRKTEDGRAQGTAPPLIAPSRGLPLPIPNYFPASCEHEFGSLPVPPFQTRSKNIFPHNVVFRTVDWAKEDVLEDAEGYDVVLGFSVSKWIHLNDRDEGLKSFFHKVFRVLHPGGVFVLEPQGWDTYTKAKRMSEKLKENAKMLELRPEGFEQVLLEEIGFASVERLGLAGDGGFRRPVDLYRKWGSH
ncbi:Bin3-domain-containing protein [Pluteus cervinus]|uniref:Bin3-domain-containing protein n=1 Tax=Pluteus cervinus TaxID=181527 RepID=A0ACD3B0P0_9AGAR|nr:Bin3-domain-containing protein [Pluteus cervinus]